MYALTRAVYANQSAWNRNMPSLRRPVNTMANHWITEMISAA